MTDASAHIPEDIEHQVHERDIHPKEVEEEARQKVTHLEPLGGWVFNQWYILQGCFRIDDLGLAFADSLGFLSGLFGHEGFSKDVF